MIFEWDKSKNIINIEKHGLSFEYAKLLFNNPMMINRDIRFSYNEERFIGYGQIDGRLMCVVYTKRESDKIRIISFRKANSREKKYYEQVYRR